MDLPIILVMDKATQEIRDYVASLMKRYNLNADVMEFVLYKVLSNIQESKSSTYAQELINQLVEAHKKEMESETEQED